MALGWKPTFANSLLDSGLKNTAFTGPAVVAMQLHKGDPGSAGTSNVADEATRKAVTFASASGGSSASNNAQTWTNVTVTSPPQTYTHFSLWDSATTGAGNFIGSGTMTANAVNSGDTFTVASGSTTVALSVAA